MTSRYIPEFLRHAPAPGVKGFAILSGLDASVRASLISVWPLVMYRELGDVAAVSRVYFLVGIAALFLGLMVPWMGRFIPRRWMYTLGVSFYLGGPALALFGGPLPTALGLGLTSGGTVTIFISLNAYVMDYIARTELGKGETLKLLYSGVSWAAGPVLGVWMLALWPPLPFLVAMGFAMLQGTVFWIMRLGNGKLIMRARAPTPNPLAFLGRFFAQPRLVAGWSFAVLRSCGWWVYVVYLPMFCIERGLGEQTGGFALSLSNGFLLLAPFMLRWMQAHSLRFAVRTGFLMSGSLFLLGTFGMIWPPIAVGALFMGSFFLVLLDMCGGLPFLMAVKPSERGEMSAVYSSFRDVSGIVTPGAAWLVLLVAPLSGVFAVCGLGLLGAWVVAGNLHPKLGARR